MFSEYFTIFWFFILIFFLNNQKPNNQNLIDNAQPTMSPISGILFKKNINLIQMGLKFKTLEFWALNKEKFSIQFVFLSI